MSPIYFQIFFLIAFLEGACIRNIIILMCINYMIISLIIFMYLITIMEGYAFLFCCSKFSWARDRISSKFLGTLGMFLKKFCHPWCSCLGRGVKTQRGKHCARTTKRFSPFQ